ncbi:MAG: hypothetical protein B6I30_05060 [Desulfobacteraceae bacterium 4572_187]|nr:MAG: hypothetical protein B6I30_05060 [Desulfobacteraceae bacterium 4572_187]
MSLIIKPLPAKAGRFLVQRKVGHFPLIEIVYQGEIGLISFFSPQSYRGHRGTSFCLSGDDGKQKINPAFSTFRPKAWVVYGESTSPDSS